MLFGLITGFGIIATVYSMWKVYDVFFTPDDEDETLSISYVHDADFFEDPQMGLKFLIEDPEGVDAHETLEAVNEWIRADDPNIITGDYRIKVNTFDEFGLVQISGDASPLILDNYEDVELPYVDGDNNLEWVKVDLDFS